MVDFFLPRCFIIPIKLFTVRTGSVLSFSSLSFDFYLRPPSFWLRYGLSPSFCIEATHPLHHLSHGQHKYKSTQLPFLFPLLSGKRKPRLWTRTKVWRSSTQPCTHPSFSFTSNLRFALFFHYPSPAPVSILTFLPLPDVSFPFSFPTLLFTFQWDGEWEQYGVKHRWRG